MLDNVLKKDQLTSLEKTLKDLNIVSYNMKDDVSIDKDFEKFLNSDEINNILDIYKGKYLKKLSEIKNINEMKTKKESFYIYTLIINVLSSLFKENNEQASLLYKLFKMYSGKQEQKWLNVINKVKKKEEYYMGLTREILIHKNKEVKNIEEISNLLINQADTKTESERIEMIQRYKENIILLLEELQKVKEKYYGIKGELEMDTILFNKFIYHFDTLKYSKDLVEIINHLDRDNLYYYTKQELQHKNYSEEKYVFLLIVIYINV